MTSETVRVLVRVAVVLIVLVCAMARKGSSTAAVRVGRCIAEVCKSECMWHPLWRYLQIFENAIEWSKMPGDRSKGRDRDCDQMNCCFDSRLLRLKLARLRCFEMGRMAKLATIPTNNQ